MATNFALRLDVDTHICAREGIRPLLDLADELDVKFTFYVNFGRSIALGQSFKKLIQPATVPDVAAHYSAFQKLGFAGFAEAALMNPQIRKYKDVFVETSNRGHEVGVHGGRNHEKWVSDSLDWSRSKLLDELVWSHLQFESILNRKPAGFASPGWVSPPALAEILRQLGYEYYADSHGAFSAASIGQSPITSVHTSLTGEPGGVGYFENQFAANKSIIEVRNGITMKVKSENDRPYVIAYDHPFFVGRRALDSLRDCLRSLLNEGVQFNTVQELVKCQT